MPTHRRGEVWLADLGMAAKVRPCLVLSVPPELRDRAVVTLIPHTTAVRGTGFEVTIAKPFLEAGAFDAQGPVTVAPSRLLRRLGALAPSELATIEQAVRRWLAL